MQPMPLFMTAAKGGRRRQPADHAGRPHPLERPAGRGRAGRDAGAGRSRQVADRAYATRPRPSAPRSTRPRRTGTEPGMFMGQPLEAGDRRRRGGARRGAVSRSTPTTARRATTTTPSSRTRRPLAWNGDELMVHDASQAVAHTAWSLAKVFGLDEKQVHVTSPYVGGGFGGKTLWQHQVLGAAAAKLAGRPVRIALSREGVYRMVGGRTLTEQRVAIGADGDGRFTAIIHTGTVAMTHHNAHARAVHPAGTQRLRRRQLQARRRGGLYGHARQHLHARAGRVGRHVRAGMRGRRTGGELGIDPIELRIRNEPRRTRPTGKPFSIAPHRRGLARRGRTLRLGEAQAVSRARCATASGWSAWAVRPRPIPITACPAARRGSRLTRDGHAKVEIAAHEMGMGTATAQTQVDAERLGLAMDQVTFAYGDSTMPGARAGRRIAADRLHRRRRDRGAACAGRRTARARGQ